MVRQFLVCLGLATLQNSRRCPEDQGISGKPGVTTVAALWHVSINYFVPCGGGKNRPRSSKSNILLSGCGVLGCCSQGGSGGGTFGRLLGPGAERLPSIGTIISVFGVTITSGLRCKPSDLRLDSTMRPIIQSGQGRTNASGPPRGW